MRRLIFSLLIALLTTSHALATSKPSLDGRAVVAEEGMMPAGFFAKTVGYLPGDSVSVTNPATGITVNVLVLGSIDPSAGVAILLSPEAADKLFITPESNTQVKITKRTGMLDEAGFGSGTVVADTPADGRLPNQTKDALDSRLTSLDETLGAASAPEEAAAMDSTETAAATEDAAAESQAAEDLGETAMAADDSDAESNPDADSTETAFQEADSEYAITAVEEVPLNHVLAEHDPVYIVETLTEDPFEGFEREEEIAELPDEGASAAEAPAPETASGDFPADSPEHEAVPADESPSENALALVPVEAGMETCEEGVPSEGAQPEAAGCADVAAEDTDLIDPFAPIILVPAEENPPMEAAQSTFTPVPAIQPAPAESAVAKNLPPSSSLGSAGQKNMVKSLSELESGKYYVQVATFAEQENIDKLLKEYGSKYPFVMVPLKSGSAMQMMVGPLNVDEYGAILARFKKLGFKDSFLRKIR